MNLGREFSVPQDKRIVQNSSIWIPLTPQKPVTQKPTYYAQPERQQNQTGPETWDSLLGIYKGFLQGESCSGPPQNFQTTVHQAKNPKNMQDLALFQPPVQNFNLTGHLDLNYGEQIINGVPLIETYNSPFGSEALNIQHVDERPRNLNHAVGITGSFMQNSGNVVPTPKKVDSLEELMSPMSGQHASLRNRSTYIRKKPVTISPQSEVDINQSTWKSACNILQPNYNLPADHDPRDYNLQQMSNSELSIPHRHSYNLNLPPRSEDGESLNAARTFHLGPVTPDEKWKPKNSQIIQVPHWLVEQNSAQERAGKQDNGVLSSQQTEIVEINDDESIHETLDTSSGAILKSSGEMNISEGGHGGINLNNTPPLKPPKRRKHRPKVVVEKPKRTPKPKNSTHERKPTEKRKYVRRSDSKTSSTPSTDAANNVEVLNTESARKSCRRSLNFDSENGVGKQSSYKEVDYQAGDRIKVPFNVNLDLHGAEMNRALNETLTSVVKDGNGDLYGNQKHEMENSNNFECSIRQSLSQQSLLVKGNKVNVIARNLSMRNANHTMQNRTQLLQNLLDVREQQGSKGENYHTKLTQTQPTTPMGSQLGFNGVPNMGQSKDHFWKNDSESNNKKKADDKFQGTSSSMASGITTVENCLGQFASSKNQHLQDQRSSVYVGGLPNSHGKGKCTSVYPDNEASNARCDPYKISADFFQQQNNASQMNQCAAQLGQEMFHEPQLTQANEMRSSPVNVPKKRQKSSPREMKNSRGSKTSSKKVTGSREEKVALLSVDYITDRMKNLHINNRGKEIVLDEQNVLVPFRGDGVLVPYEATNKRKPRPKVDLDLETNRLWNLLMYKEGSESAETMDSDKQKWWDEERKVFRGRVDSFIARMHLVQGDRRFSRWKGSVVDSVIGVFLTQNVSDHLSSSAFMSLAAKFPLKSKSSCQTREGSSFGHNEVQITYPDGSSYSYHKEMRDHGAVISYHSSEFREQNSMREIQPHVLNNHIRRIEEDLISSQSSSESFIFHVAEDIRSSSGSNSEIEDQTVGWKINEKHDHPSFGETNERIAVSRQYPFQVTESSFQNKGQFLGNNQKENPAQMYLEPETVTKTYSYPLNSNFPHHQSPIPASSGFRPNAPNLEKWEADFLADSGKESVSYLASTEFGITNSTGATHYNGGQSVENSVMATHTLLQQISNTPMAPAGINDIRVLNYRKAEMQQTFEQEGTFLTDLNKPAETSSKQQTDSKAYTEIQTLEPNGMEQAHSSSNQPSGKIGTTGSNARKRKAEKLKPEPINWDTLRKEVKSKPGTRGTSTDAMDSLDYEALKNADVRVISDTIKERGMNNMLAERMKDFLNRVDRDHGKIDLEWLRDVQPDKAKDYLLSIRGLGLKSVECVRLLTLHHLAFPVDTNVGRIAVRLGWVPLQPLPESLQLHLLELYPVLESIQKYLWPRLCKLDQETLYELHYQMITFGKVFCTKREPNCNSCPMRGECRHFASAFASARLALPGPEEKRIVRSSIPTTANKSSNVIINLMPLLSVRDSSEQDVGFKKNCEPIIEEPASPEPPPEISVKDIEDAFYEDPDDIPVIKLNIEEFTTNLQTFMQENMEMQEGDLSRALVALSPEVASIPMPKLKHISRLRTEHQVYELPDSHPLLKGLDRREPDDPSPYLLAIWAPGETPDSVQPPESKCGTQDAGGLCSKKTCFSCNSTRETQAQTVRGTILIPCRTAMRGSFPLNGTYFQVNEVFADQGSSINPIDVPRSLLWNLPRRTVFFGTSVSSIFKGLSTEDIQYCFWKGFVCVRGFDRESRAPRPLMARLHLPASRMAKKNERR